MIVLNIAVLIFGRTCAALPACIDDDDGFQTSMQTSQTCAEGSSQCLDPNMKQFCCATCKVIQHSNYAVWNSQSLHLNKAASISFWTAFYAGNPAETGQVYNIGFDTHLMHGIVASDGSFIGVGFCLSAEQQGADRDMVIIRTSGTNGAMLNHWRSTWAGDDVAVAVGQFENDLLVAGFSRSSMNDVAKRVLVKFGLNTLERAWTASFADSAAATHSSFEAIVVVSDGVWLGGCKENQQGTEFFFKSSGNIPEGTAFASFISAENLRKQQAPSSEDLTWKDTSWTSVKALDFTTEGNTGYVIAALHKDHNGHPSGALVKLTASAVMITKVWGPTVYNSQTEVTDVAVAPDGSGYVVTGHGSVTHLTNPSNPAAYYGRFTRVDTTGQFLWTVNISVGKPSILYTECFAVQPVGWDTGNPGWIAACGSGIEGVELCNKLTDTDKLNCLDGIGDDIVPGAPKRNPGIWVANIPRLQDSTTSTPPQFYSMLLTSHLQEGQTPGPQGSTGAEFIWPTPDGGFYVTTDEEFGAGFLKLGPEPTPSSASTNPVPTPSPPPQQTDGVAGAASKAHTNKSDVGFAAPLAIVITFVLMLTYHQAV